MFKLNEYQKIWLENTIIKLSKTYFIPPLEPCDIANELRLHLWLKRGLYNPKKSAYQTWATRVCKNKIKNLARQYSKEIKTISFEKLKENGTEIEG